jgi:peptide deformylase
MEILKIGDERLHLPCTEVTDIETVKPLVEEMITIINTEETRGLGLAAPQVGQNIRLFVMRQNIDSKAIPMMDKLVVAVINPIIKKSYGGDAIYREGCLSVPDKLAVVRRQKHVKVKYTDINGKTVTVTLSNTDAIVFQHELDHLNGLLMTDRVERPDYIIDIPKPVVVNTENPQDETEIPAAAASEEAQEAAKTEEPGTF